MVVPVADLAGYRPRVGLSLASATSVGLDYAAGLLRRGHRVRAVGQAMRGPSRDSRRMTGVAPISLLDPPTTESLSASVVPSQCCPCCGVNAFSV